MDISLNMIAQKISNLSTRQNSNSDNPAARCPVCLETGRNLTPYFLGKHIYSNNFEYSYLTCKKCKLVFTFPFPTDDILAQMYHFENYGNVYPCNNSFSYHGSPGSLPSGLSDSPQRKKDKALLLEILTECQSRLKKSNCSFFDFGCGNGDFLLYAKNIGLHVTGHEPLASNAKRLSKVLGSEILHGSIDSLISSGVKYDIIFLADVLEHVSNPIEVIQSLNKILSSNGVFIILTPLENSMDFSQVVLRSFKFIKKVIGGSKITEAPPYHVLLFNKKSFSKMLNQAGIRPIKYIPYCTEWPFVFDSKKPNPRSIILGTIGKLNVFLGESYVGKFCGMQNRALVVAEKF